MALSIDAGKLVGTSSSIVRIGRGLPLWLTLHGCVSFSSSQQQRRPMDSSPAATGCYGPDECRRISHRSSCLLRGLCFCIECLERLDFVFLDQPDDSIDDSSVASLVLFFDPAPSTMEKVAAMRFALTVRTTMLMVLWTASIPIACWSQCVALRFLGATRVRHSLRKRELSRANPALRPTIERPKYPSSPLPLFGLLVDLRE